MSFSNDDRREQLGHSVDLFNRQEFFACHDVLEEIWGEIVDDDREFYQGLIHAAVALFHFGESNLGGALKMHRSAVGYLTPFQPHHQGIDVSRLLEEFQECFAELAQPHQQYPAHIQLDPQSVPQIHFIGEDS